jgi:hypothetical protein
MKRTHWIALFCIVSGFVLYGCAGISSFVSTFGVRDVKPIFLGSLASGAINKGTTLVVPPVIWHVYEEDFFAHYNQTIHDNVYNNIGTLPYLNKLLPQSFLEASFPTEC